jgi:hypothetical protein
MYKLVLPAAIVAALATYSLMALADGDKPQKPDPKPTETHTTTEIRTRPDLHDPVKSPLVDHNFTKQIDPNTLDPKQ